MAANRRGGRLFLVGGHAGVAWDDPEILGELIRLAGGAASARVVLASAVGRDDRGPEDRARKAMGRLGVADFRSLGTAWSDDAGRARALGIVERATALVLDGDDPERLVRDLRETRLDATIRRRLADSSLLVAGLGLAAVALAGRMLVDDEPDPDHGPDPSRTEPIAGLGYLPGVVLDPFFSRDGRPDRLISALAEGPGDLGLGIEESTALVVDRGLISVIGRGSAMIVDVSAAAAGGMATRYSLRAGDRFDLPARAPIGPGSPAPGA